MSKTTNLTAAERARKYREKIKLDKARNDEYKNKKKESRKSNHKTKMEGEENIEYRSKLIDLVRENNLLWNRKNKYFANKIMKMETWNVVARELGKTSTQTRRVWQNLRDQYRRSFKRHLLFNIEPTWIFYKKMSFIQEFLRIQENSKESSDSELDMETANDQLQNELCPSQPSNGIINKNTKKDFSMQFYSKGEATKEERNQDSEHVTVRDSSNDVSIKDETAAFDLNEIIMSCEVVMRTPVEGTEEMETQPTQITEKGYSSKRKLSLEPSTNSSPKIDLSDADEPLSKRPNLDECGNRVKKGTKNLYAKVDNENVNTKVSEKKEAEIRTPSKAKADAVENEVSVCLNTCSKKYDSVENNKLILPKLEIIELDDEDTPEAEIEYVRPKTTSFKEPIETRKSKTNENSTSAFVSANRQNANNKHEDDIAPHERDEDYHFVMSILPFMLRVNLAKKLQTRRDILKVVMENLDAEI